MRRLLLPLAVLAALVPASMAAAQTPGPLSPERYTALDQILTALIPVEDRDKVTKTQYADATKACSALAGPDPVLDRYRGLCEATIAGSRVVERLDRCTGPSSCRSAIAALRKQLKALMTAGRRLNRVLAVEVPDAKCRKALDQGAEEQRGLRQIDGAYKSLSDGLRLKSDRKLREAIKRLDKVRGVPSGAQRRGRLRDGCR